MDKKLKEEIVATVMKAQMEAAEMYKHVHSELAGELRVEVAERTH